MCGGGLSANRASYCSNACRQAAYRRRVRQQAVASHPRYVRSLREVSQPATTGSCYVTPPNVTERALTILVERVVRSALRSEATTQPIDVNDADGASLLPWALDSPVRSFDEPGGAWRGATDEPTTERCGRVSEPVVSICCADDHEVVASPTTSRLPCDSGNRTTAASPGDDRRGLPQISEGGGRDAPRGVPLVGHLPHGPTPLPASEGLAVREVQSVDVNRFYADIVHALGAHAESGGTAYGAAVVVKRVAREHGVARAEALPLPRPTRAERAERADRSWVRSQGVR